jgi:hypothetical protein
MAIGFWVIFCAYSAGPEKRLDVIAMLRARGCCLKVLGIVWPCLRFFLDALFFPRPDGALSGSASGRFSMRFWGRCVLDWIVGGFLRNHQYVNGGFI